MAINSRQKGKRGEREAVQFLKSLGFTGARRSQQYCGGTESSDVIVPELPSVHFEVKYGYPIGKFDICTALFQQACKQADKDSGYGVWVVLWKPKYYKEWRLSFRDSWELTVTVTGTDIKNALHILNS